MQLYVVRIPKSEQGDEFVHIGNKVIYLPIEYGDTGEHEMALARTPHRAGTIRIKEIHWKKCQEA